MQKFRETLASIALLLRFEYLVFALILPLLGAASIPRRLSGHHLAWLLLSALCFHIFISLQNDIVDLSLDRTDPRRRDYPLVKGTVSVRFASALALVQIPLVIGLSFWWGLQDRLVVAIVLFLGMSSIYNLWGKRTAFPIATDLAQGLGFGGLTLFGAASLGSPNLGSWMVYAGVVIWMMQTNHLGGLRDLQSDYRFGALTTPIFLGSQYGKEGCFISRKCIAYSYFLLVTQFAIPIMFLWRDRGLADPAVLAVLVILIGLVLVAAGATLWRFLAIGERQRRVQFDLGLIVMYLSALPMLAILALSGDLWVGVAVFVVILATVRTAHRVTRPVFYAGRTPLR